jgi:hypothetical protein
MSVFTSETTKASAQQALYDLTRGGVVWLWYQFVWPFLSDKAKAMNVPGAVAWGAVASLLLLYGVFLFGASIWSRVRPKPLSASEDNRPTLRGMVIVGQSLANNSYEATINGAALRDFQKDYKLVVVCGNNDPTVDKLEDTRISKSQAYTITSSQFKTALSFTRAQTEERDLTIERLKDEFRRENPGVPKNTPILIPIQYSHWHETVLLPKDVSVAEIRKLSDVPRHGGKVLSHEITEGRLKATTL